MYRRIFLFILLTTGSLSTWSQTLRLTEEGRLDVNGNLQYFRDSTDTLALQDVRSKAIYADSFGSLTQHWLR